MIRPLHLLKIWLLISISLILSWGMLEEIVLAGTNYDLATSSNYNIRYDGDSGTDGDFWFGCSAVGDLNGDGEDDLVLSGYAADYNGRVDSGSVYVIYSTTLDDFKGTGNTVDLSDTSKFNIRFDGELAGDQMASWLTIGDVNNDGRNDLIIAAATADHAGRTDCGAVYVIYSDLFDNYPDTSTGNILDLADDSPPGPYYNIKYYSKNQTGGAQLGHGHTCIADVNEDGKNDLIMAAHNYTLNYSYCGMVYVIDSSLVESYTTYGNDVDLETASNYTTRYYVNAGPIHTGMGLAVGDINEDGYADLAMGAYTWPGGSDYSGAVYVLYSSLIKTQSGSINFSTTSNFNIRFEGIANEYRLGEDVAIGDVNGDGKKDLIMGMCRGDYNADNTGSCYIVYSSKVKTWTGTANSAPLSTTSNFNIRFDGDATENWLGYHIDVGDINDDGYDDLICSAYRADFNSRTDSGSTYVIYSTLIDDYTTTGNILRLNNSNYYNLRYDGTATDGSGILGLRLAVGDINRDGVVDLIMDERNADYNGRTDSGSTYILFGSQNSTKIPVYNFVLKNPNGNNTDEILVDWEGQSTVAPSGKSIYLQVFNFQTQTWATQDTESSAGANEEFSLVAQITANESDYYQQVGSEYWSCFRVYQESTDGTLKSDAFYGSFSPTAVGLVDFFAIGYDSKVILKWNTATEIDNFGFNLYRSEQGGSYTKLNSSLIVGQGTSSMGYQYQFIDETVTNGKTYSYLLEDVAYDGTTTKHGPVLAHPGLDSDSDGMSDDYERHFGLNPDDPLDASLDSDGDGKTNLEEYLELTDPNKAEVVPIEEQEEISIIEQGADYLVLELNTSLLNSRDITVDTTTYQELWLPEYLHSFTSTPGQPKLPEKGVLISTSTFNQANLEIIDSEYTTYLNYNLYPQERYIQEQDPETGIVWLKKDFYKDETCYSQDEFLPGNLADIDYSYYLREQKMINLRLYPLQYNPSTKELKFYTKIKLRVNFSSSVEEPASFNIPDELYKSGSIKLFIQDEGMYKLTKSYLESQGINTSLINPNKLRLFNQGKEIPIHIQGGEDGSLDASDYIEFYAEQIDSEYTTHNLYWLSLNETKTPLSIETEDEPTGLNFLNQSSTSFSKHIELEEDYWLDVKGTQDSWFFSDYLWATPTTSCTKNYTFTLENLLTSFSEAELTLGLYGVSYDTSALNHHLRVYLNDYFIAEESWSGDSEHKITTQLPAYYLLEGENTLTLELPGGLSQVFEVAVLDYIDVTYPKKLIAQDNQLIFSPKLQGSYEFIVDGFTQENIKVYKIKSEGAVKEIIHLTILPSANYSATFKDIPELTDKYLILTESNYKSPETLTIDTASDLTSNSQQADYLIITPESFSNTIQELANYRSSQGLKVETVKLQDIYDEFSFGLPTPQALKDFLSYAYHNWSKPAPSYVLLVGDTTFDYKDNYEYGLFDYIPTHYIYNPLFGWTADDSYFVCFDSEDDLLPEMLLGRLPVKTEKELSIIIDKIKSYEALDEDELSWLKTVTLLADKADENSFPAMSNNLANSLPAGFTTNKLYYDNYSSSQTIKEKIIDSLNNGTLLFTYTGHGGVQLMSKDKIFQNSDINSLFNKDEYPFILLLTCANGYFLYPRYFECLAEDLLKAEDKGAIGVLASSGVTYSERQMRLGEGLYKAIFTDDDYVLGSSIAQAKVYLYNLIGEEGKYVSKTFNLFADPALRLKGYDAAQERKNPSNQQQPAAFNLAGLLNNEGTVYSANIVMLEDTSLEQETKEKPPAKETKTPKDKPSLPSLRQKLIRGVLEQERDLNQQEEQEELPLIISTKEKTVTAKPRKSTPEQLQTPGVKDTQEYTLEETKAPERKTIIQKLRVLWQQIKQTILDTLRNILERIKNWFRE